MKKRLPQSASQVFCIKATSEWGSIFRSSPAYSGPFWLAYYIKYIQPTSSISPAYSVISFSLLIPNVEVDLMHFHYLIYSPHVTVHGMQRKVGGVGYIYIYNYI